jgi:CRP/FNR family cyclic AMP-dependent transcriptional regulator
MNDKTTTKSGTKTAGDSLAGIELLKPLKPQELASLEMACTWRTARKGQEILNRKSENREVFFVVSGKAQIVNYSLSGREVAYATAEAGEYFGELSAIDGQPRSAHVVALENCRTAALEPDAFRALLMDHPEVAIAVLEKLARVVRACDERIMDLATLSAYQRVYGEILKLMRPDPVRAGSWLVYPLPTQARIAAQASTTRETVARVLGQLASAGIAERKSKTLYIREVDKLRALADRLGASSQE